MTELLPVVELSIKILTALIGLVVGAHQLSIFFSRSRNSLDADLTLLEKIPDGMAGRNELEASISRRLLASYEPRPSFIVELIGSIIRITLRTKLILEEILFRAGEMIFGLFALILIVEGSLWSIAFGLFGVMFMHLADNAKARRFELPNRSDHDTSNETGLKRTCDVEDSKPPSWGR